MITHIDKFKQRMINENLDVNDYINQLNNNEYSKLSDNLYSDIEDEGWLEQLEDFYNRKFNKNDFSFTTLNLTSKDKNGLIEFDGDVIEKFNDFDIKLKSMSEYPFNKLDLIDYDNGVVYIIRLNMELRKFKTTLREFLNENIENISFNEQLKNNFKKINISFIETYSDNLDLYMNNKKIGTLRFYIEENWLVIDNIELYNDYIGKGIGFSIYETLYKTTKDIGLNGVFSKLFSKETVQKRSKLATKVLDKLINKYGGEKHDCSQWLSDDYKNDDDVYDYLIDGRGKIEIRVV